MKKNSIDQRFGNGSMHKAEGYVTKAKSVPDKGS